MQNSWASDPFGAYLKAFGAGADATEHHFTGKERDAETGLDYFGARYSSGALFNSSTVLTTIGSLMGGLLKRGVRC